MKRSQARLFCSFLLSSCSCEQEEKNAKESGFCNVVCLVLVMFEVRYLL